MSRLDEIKKEIAKLEAEKEQLENLPRWRAKDREWYHYLGNNGRHDETNELGDYEDDWRYNTGNYFQTKTETLAYREYLEAKSVIRKDAGGYKFNKDKENHFGIYTFSPDRLWFDYSCWNYSPDTIYFESQEAIEESQDKHPKEWLTYVTYGLPEEVSNE